MAKLSGPLLDRFDLIIDVAAIAPIQLLDSASGQQSKDIKARIEQARRFALDRAKEVQLKAQNFGAEPQADDLSDALNDEAKQFIRQAIESLSLTGRGYHKLLKVARTIADLEGATDVQKHHLQEAVSYRQIRLLT